MKNRLYDTQGTLTPQGKLFRQRFVKCISPFIKKNFSKFDMPDMGYIMNNAISFELVMMNVDAPQIKKRLK